MGDLADQHNNIIQISTGFKIQVIDGYGGGIPAAVTSGSGSGYFIDPLQQSSAEQAPETVDIRMNDHMQLMCLGIGDFFRRKCTRLFFCIFSRICCIHSYKTSHIF